MTSRCNVCSHKTDEEAESICSICRDRLEYASGIAVRGSEFDEECPSTLNERDQLLENDVEANNTGKKVSVFDKAKATLNKTTNSLMGRKIDSNVPTTEKS